MNWRIGNSKFSGLLWLLISTLAVFWFQPSNVSAADDGWGPGQDTWKFELGGYFPSSNTNLEVDGVDTGSDLDLEDKLQ
jgi:hypothetical protein